MKKIFLLSLLSILLLSAFSQEKGSNTEILTKINIIKNVPDEEIHGMSNSPLYFLFFYNEVKTEILPDGTYAIYCIGIGKLFCFLKRDILQVRGISSETVENTCTKLIEECDEKIANGEYRGSISKKISISGFQSIFLFQMNWNHDPQKPYNGEEEIIISKTENFGL